MLSTGSHCLAPCTEVVRRNGRILARKRYPRPNPVARMLLNHEASILRSLGGVDGIPRVEEFKAGRHLLLEFVRGRHVHECPSEFRTREVFGRLEDLVDRMHARRVVHLDLRQRRNILIDEEGRPAIVDFQSSVRFPDNGLFNPLVDLCRWVDRSALRRWKNRYFPELMTERDRAAIRLHAWTRPFWFLSPFKRRESDRV